MNANTNGIRIEYETFGDASSPALLLIMGLAGQLIHWQDGFCQKIAEKGYHVIRYDNRDAGLSTKFDELRMPEIMAKIGAIFSGQKVSIPYTIEDMADDAAGLLDALNIGKAHICGMSMGGFIAQAFAIKNPFRTLSLTSIHSHCGASKKFIPAQEVLEAMLVPTPEERGAYIQHMVNIFKLTYGSGVSFDEEYHRQIAGKAFDRSFCPEGEARQYLAIMLQKDRTAELAKMKVPSLIIHGDEDPLVPLAGGKATADAISGAEFRVLKGMGHVMPNLNAYWDDIKDAMLHHMGKAEK